MQFSKNVCLVVIISKLNVRALFIVTFFISITLSIFLYVCSNQQSKQDTVKLLRKLQNKFSELKQRHIFLQKSIDVNTQKLVKNIRNHKVPTFEHELLRRRVMRDIQEIWYFIGANMNDLKSRPNMQASAISIIKKILSLGFEYKRTLANNIEKLTTVDGFNYWRNNEIVDLSNIVQTRLHYLQNPLNCENVRKLVCSISYPCGFGCQMHHLISCMALAYGMQRTLILVSTGWQYHRGGWNEVFMPLSNNCTTIGRETTDAWPGTNNSKIIHISLSTYILPRSHYLPLAVPEDLFVRLKLIHGNPTVWWIGQLLKYIWKPNNLTTNYINDNTKKLDPKSPLVGVHIRRTDKIVNEAKYIAIEEYMKKVDEYYSLIGIKSNVTKRRVYIATEDFNVITEAKTKYPHYDILYNENIPKIPKTNPTHSDDNILDVILDIHVLVNSDFLVCTFSSNLGRLAYALKQINYVDASTKCVSLDAIYVYTQQNANQCKAILNHKAQTTDEIDLVLGDIVNITQYTLNGYSLGTNLRTNKNGWYPSFKVEMESEIVKFPTYSEVNYKQTL